MRAIIIGVLLVLAAAMNSRADTIGADTIDQVLANPQRLAQDRERDARDQPEVVLALLHLEPGDTVADIFAGSGYYSELLGRLLGPDGKVLMHNNEPYLKYVEKDLKARFNGRELPGVVRHDREPGQMDLGESTLDAAMIIMSYHDLFYSEEGWPPIDRADFMGQIVAALKPGGRFLIMDHQATAGTGSDDSEHLHRIEAAFAKQDIERFGLRYVAGSDALANKEDDHSLNVFDKAIRGKTDRFVQVFEKPAQGQQSQQ